MRNKTEELDVDYVGSQGSSLTKEEEKMISNFISLSKAKKTNRTSKKGA